MKNGWKYLSHLDKIMDFSWKSQEKFYKVSFLVDVGQKRRI